MSGVKLLPHDRSLRDIMLRRSHPIDIGELAFSVLGKADPISVRRVRRSLARLRGAGYQIDHTAHGMYRMGRQHRSGLPEVPR